MVITRTKTKAEGSVKYECPERNDSLGKETKQPNLQKEERSDKSLRVVVVTKRGWVVNQINQTYFLKGLRMKKSVCLMAILGAFALSANAAKSDQSVDITFTGKVIAENCKVDLAQGGTSLNLGTIKKDEVQNGKGTIVPVLMKLSNCGDSLKTVSKFELVHDLSTANSANTNLTNGTLSTNDAGVVVQFYTKADGSAEGKPALIGNSTISNKNGTFLGGYVSLKKISAAALNAGDITAKGMFNITFN